MKLRPIRVILRPATTAFFRLRHAVCVGIGTKLIAEQRLQLSLRQLSF